MIYMTKSAPKKIFDEKIPDARVNKLPLRKNRSKKNQPRCVYSTDEGRRVRGGQALPATS